MKNKWQIIAILLAVAILILSRMLTIDNEKLSVEVSAGENLNLLNKDAYSIIMNRSSVRSYTDEIIPIDVMEKILKAGMAAPSGKNIQPWELIVVRDKQMLYELSEAQPYARGKLNDATAAIIVCGRPSKDKDDREGSIYWDVDAAAVTQNILLAAEYFGVGAVWTTTHPHQEPIKNVRKLLNIPENITPLCIISMGYPDAEKRVKDKWKPEKVHYEKW